MTAAALSLPGGSLEHLERRGTWLVATLAVEGTRVQLLFFHGAAQGTVESLPLALATGRLDTPEGPLGASIPVPFPQTGAVELHLEGLRGERLTIVGQSLTVREINEDTVVSLGRSRPSVP